MRNLQVNNPLDQPWMAVDMFLVSKLLGEIGVGDLRSAEVTTTSSRGASGWPGRYCRRWSPEPNGEASQAKGGLARRERGVTRVSVGEDGEHARGLDIVVSGSEHNRGDVRQGVADRGEGREPNDAGEDEVEPGLSSGSVPCLFTWPAPGFVICATPSPSEQKQSRDQSEVWLMSGMNIDIWSYQGLLWFSGEHSGGEHSETLPVGQRSIINYSSTGNSLKLFFLSVDYRFYFLNIF